MSNPHVFLDVVFGPRRRAGRLLIELYVDEAKEACDRFMQLLSSHAGSTEPFVELFERIDDGIMVRGQRLTQPHSLVGIDVCGAGSRLGDGFSDKEYAGKGCHVAKGMLGFLSDDDTPNMFEPFIALGPLPHSSTCIHNLFGNLISSPSLLDAIIAESPIDASNSNHIIHPVLLHDSGTLEPPPVPTPTGGDTNSTSRGRHKRRRLASHSPPRSASPSRGHNRASGSRHRRHARAHHRPDSLSPSSSSMTPPHSLSPLAKKKTKIRRRSDAEPDHNFRGRARKRSRTRSPIEEEGSWGHRKRSPPPSRHRYGQREDGKGSGSTVRRQRSLPNLYRGEEESVRAGGEAGSGLMEEIKAEEMYKGKENEGVRN
ncbi:hypothetical protein BCR34DRAFT_573356 [Clohesyomyces aquaticus]|uniref:PPIase cyclophilin-type domain-containing protein n=1 Tax=Clohesyomyces aquaticus TaxID=1231657 RepID=A0A1Y1Z034_9PLEO|nr:hypothetical protein BCR34DRAFT_573356 [Clohesyomyces aquaticus]